MKRAIYVGLGTIAGTVAVLGYHPGALFTTAGGSTAQAAEASSATTSTDTTTSTSSGAQTYNGDVVSTRYGDVQVQVQVENGSVTSVTTLTVPQNDPHSAQISAVAIPELEQQAVTAQSSALDGVSGASYTTAGFEQSLQSALVQAGLA